MQVKQNKGSALIIATTVIFVIITLVASLIAVSTSGTNINRRRLATLTTKYTVKGALSATVIAANKSKDIQEIQGNGAHWDSIIVKLADGNWKQLSTDLGEISSPHAAQVLANHNKGLPQRPGLDFIVQLQPYGSDGIKATASSMSASITYTLVGYIFPRQQGPAGIFGDRRVEICGNNSVDSFDSAISAYGGDNIRAKASIGSNGPVNLIGNVKVHGDARPGPGFTVNHPEKVTGKTTAYTRPVPLRPVDESWLQQPSEDFPKTSPVVLADGAYHYSRISLKSNQCLLITGTVTIYCHEAFVAMAHSELQLQTGSQLILYVGGRTKFSGKFSAKGARPAIWQIRSSYFDENFNANELPDSYALDSWGVAISGSTAVSAVVYAPKAAVLIAGNSDFCGAVVGYAVRIAGSGKSDIPNPHNAKFHCDEDIKEPDQADKRTYYLAESFPG